MKEKDLVQKNMELGHDKLEVPLNAKWQNNGESTKKPLEESINGEEELFDEQRALRARQQKLYRDQVLQCEALFTEQILILDQQRQNGSKLLQKKEAKLQAAKKELTLHQQEIAEMKRKAERKKDEIGEQARQLAALRGKDVELMHLQALLKKKHQEELDTLRKQDEILLREIQEFEYNQERISKRRAEQELVQAEQRNLENALEKERLKDMERSERAREEEWKRIECQRQVLVQKEKELDELFAQYRNREVELDVKLQNELAKAAKLFEENLKEELLLKQRAEQEKQQELYEAHTLKREVEFTEHVRKLVEQWQHELEVRQQKEAELVIKNKELCRHQQEIAEMKEQARQLACFCTNEAERQQESLEKQCVGELYNQRKKEEELFCKIQELGRRQEEISAAQRRRTEADKVGAELQAAEERAQVKQEKRKYEVAVNKEGENQWQWEFHQGKEAHVRMKEQDKKKIRLEGQKTNELGEPESELDTKSQSEKNDAKKLHKEDKQQVIHGTQQTSCESYILDEQKKEENAERHKEEQTQVKQKKRIDELAVEKGRFEREGEGRIGVVEELGRGEEQKKWIDEDF